MYCIIVSFWLQQQLLLFLHQQLNNPSFYLSLSLLSLFRRQKQVMAVSSAAGFGCIKQTQWRSRCSLKEAWVLHRNLPAPQLCVYFFVTFHFASSAEIFFILPDQPIAVQAEQGVVEKWACIAIGKSRVSDIWQGQGLADPLEILSYNCCNCTNQMVRYWSKRVLVSSRTVCSSAQALGQAWISRCLWRLLVLSSSPQITSAISIYFVSHGQ